MKILVIEDEMPAAKRLTRLILEVEPSAQVIAQLDSVEDSVEFFQSGVQVDLILMDIQLADGISFDIFQKVKVPAPVIFTTAYDHFALKAFKVNSVDYLLKPVEAADLKSAVEKFKSLHARENVMSHDLTELLKTIQEKRSEYKKRFLVKTAGRLAFIVTSDIAYFFSDEGNTFLVTHRNDRFLLDEILEDIETQVDPEMFFRISRKMLISLQSIKRIEPHFNNRYLLITEPPFEEEVIVSRQRGSDFKEWLDQ
jgi:two-component system response regulator LytT